MGGGAETWVRPKEPQHHRRRLCRSIASVLSGSRIEPKTSTKRLLDSLIN